ncbi:TadE-like protein [Klenkia brasiliensis]|uniref:TadE-like protein n=2 Tax=Klenkia brasiliensis TaxID=333142 RepID=A0A1G7SE91_9ACTN|nr:TadE-like protein [Klenkia brasiliensis]
MHGMTTNGSRAGTGTLDGRDRGSSSVEFALLFPVLVMVLLAGPQLGLWYFAHDAAEAAAAAGARAGSLDNAPGGAGQSAAEEYLASLGTGTITSYQIDEVRTATSVTVHVVAEVPNVIPLPGFVPVVDVSVARGLERFTTSETP